jgi:hypothetical protein
MSDSNLENLYKKVSGIVSFVAENPVRAVASSTQVWLSKWYREVSGPTTIVYVHLTIPHNAHNEITELTGLCCTHTRCLG